MKAAFIRRYGGNEVLEYGELPDPTPGPHDVLVEVHAASINPIDWKTRAGMLRRLLPYRFPLVLGSDVAGVVRACGAAATRFQPGQRVFGRVRKQRPGSFAEQLAVHEDDLALAPAGMPLIEAATIPLVGLTSWQVLHERGQLTAGQEVLIHAGSGGIGTCAIQLAKRLGATVATTASARNHPLVRELGADLAIDYRETRFEDVLGPQDLVYDTLGGETRQRSFSVLRPGGRLITIFGLPDGPSARQLGASLPIAWLATALSWPHHWRARRHGAHYEHLFMRSDGRQLAELAGFLADGSLRPIIDRTFPLAELAAAFDYSASGRARGKIAVCVREAAR